jgi:hypothetical protein
MLMSDGNKGLSGRKRRVGAMRGLISLAVIFLIALSAQASATTFLKCKKDRLAFLPSGKTLVGGGERFFTLSYNIGEKIKVRNLREHGLYCQIIKNRSDDFRIVFNCAPTRDYPSQKIEIDRMSGSFHNRIKLSEPNKDGDMEMLITGSCRKIKQKF